jgi:ABC-type branched-subunit amino acid transport system substrate-binding protein
MADTGGKDWKRVLLLGFAGVLTVVLIATIVVVGGQFTCGGPGSGVRKVGGECVGVTDGAFPFGPEFEDIQQLIKDENDRVAELGDAGRPVVRVAFLGILTFGKVSPMDSERMLRSLEGAYTAVRRANDTQNFGDQSPQIQLVLANVGSQQEQWEPVVEQLVAMSGDQNRPLVAVTGMGVSVTSTRDIAERLNTESIPMISSAVTADGLSHGPGGINDGGDEENPALPGVIRVVPSNNEYVRALGDYLDAEPDPVRAVMVYDNDTDARDLFVDTLREAYVEHLSTYLDDDDYEQPFNGTTLGENPDKPRFNAIARNVCNTGADTVLYAGRAPDLDVFLDSVGSVPCRRDDPLRVLFIATGLSVANNEKTMGIAEANDIKLVYASGIDTRWETAPPGSEAVPDGYGKFRDAYLYYLPDAEVEDLVNGYALANHDAVAVAASAVRVATAEEEASDPLTPLAVRDSLMLLNSQYSVEAGGGTLSYRSIGTSGEAIGRYVPIVELPLGDSEEPLPDPHVIGVD